MSVDKVSARPSVISPTFRSVMAFFRSAVTHKIIWVTGSLTKPSEKSSLNQTCADSYKTVIVTPAFRNSIESLKTCNESESRILENRFISILNSMHTATAFQNVRDALWG